MRIKMQRLSLLLIFLVVAFAAWADLSDYSFTQSTSTYNEITGGTILGTNENNQECFNAIPLGFTFTFNEVDYTEISVQTDGFIAFGPTVTQSNTAISSATGTNNLAVAFNRDLKSKEDGSLSYLLSGTAPNRVFTIQWKNYRRVPTSATNDVINFQIQLKEAGNAISFHYGSMSLINVSIAATVQVGLRGASNTEFLNRTTTTDWLATTAGTANNSNCRITDVIFPPSGLMFTYAPPQMGTVPMAAQTPNPAHNAINVHINAPLSWMTGGGNVDGYKLYLGTNNPPTNMVNGTTQTTTEYTHTADFTFNTDYYWKVVPFNSIGDALDCPVWKFTTLADPTVTTYPYTQNFDDVTPPAIPVGWNTINANNDNETWVTSTVYPHSGTNSIRIKYNTTMAADDWLVSPPFTLEAEQEYEIKFHYRANASTYVEKMSVHWGNAPTVAGLSNQIWINENINNTEYQEATVLITPTQSGNYYIGFRAFSDANQYYLYLDSFSISPAIPALDPPQLLTATVQRRNVSLEWQAPGFVPEAFADSFEEYTDFSLNFDPWVCVDVDGNGTYGMQNVTWPNAGSAQAFMIFNPTATTPPITSLEAQDGVKMAACFASSPAPNNDWLISPPIAPQPGDYINFWARSYTANYGLERFKVGISQGGTEPADFSIITTGNYIQAPVTWTLYSYDMSAYVGQQIRFGIQCVSHDAFILLVDDVTVGPVPTGAKHDHFAGEFMGPAIKSIVTPTPGPLYSTHNTRELLGYKVYRDGALIATVTDTNYLDPNLAFGTYSYTVTANYSNGESEPAGPVTATVAPNLFPPSNLQASVIGNTANLTWDEPIDPGDGIWISWCNDVMENAVGLNNTPIFDVAHRFTQSDLAVVQGGTITEVNIAPHEAVGTYTVKVWTGGTATSSGTLVTSQVVENVVVDQWNTVTLNTPVPIPTTGDVYIGYEINSTADYPAGCDNGPAIAGKGDMIHIDGSWLALSTVSTIDANWLIQTYVDTSDGKKLLHPQPVAEVIPAGVRDTRIASVSLDNPIYLPNPNNVSRAFLGYRVYRNDELIATVNENNYSDANLANGSYTYEVTANYTDGESVPAGPVDVVIADVPAPYDLTAEVDENNVTLNWTSPDGPMIGHWITWTTEQIYTAIGTNSAAVITVAHRFTQEDLATMNVAPGSTVSHVKFVPHHGDCVYTVKVWTNGTATSPGNLMASQEVPSFTTDDWNMVPLPTPVPIPTTGDLWVGYEANTQGGYPCGCDNGPAVLGKGDMIKLGTGSWGSLCTGSENFNLNWLIKTFISDPTGKMKALDLKPIAETPLPAYNGTEKLSARRIYADNTPRVASGFKVYRDGNLIATIDNAEIMTYSDLSLPNGTYTYGVSAVHYTGESLPAVIEVTVALQLGELVFADDFESYPDFAHEFAPWSLIDRDGATTASFGGTSFPGMGEAMAYIIFNPTATTPPMDGLTAQNGDKMAACFSANGRANDDFLISPRVHLGTNSRVRFFARSYTHQYGAELFRVGVSWAPNVTPAFQWLDANLVEAPAGWTEYIYDINAYNGRDIRIAINCQSDDAFIFFVDDFSIHSDDGYIVSGDDPSIPALTTKLDSNYPNPFNPSTTIRYSLKEAGPVSIDIYNVKGQLVRTLVNEVQEAGNHTVVWNGIDKNNKAVGSGVYFYKMNAGKYSSTKKMIMMK